VSRFFAIWLVLAGVLTVATVAVSLAVFRHVDLTFENVFQLVIVPVCQALVVTVATRSRRATPWYPALRQTLSHPLVVPVVALDAVLLGTGWSWPGHDLWGLAGAARLQTTWMGTKALAASIFLLVVARRGVTPGGRTDQPPAAATWRQRTWLLAYAAGLGALGVNAFRPWLRVVTERLGPSQPRLFRWIISYGVAYVVATAATLITASVVRAPRPTAAAAFETATATAFVCAVILVLSGFTRPYPEDPWLAIVRTAASLTATLVLVAAIMTTARSGDREVGVGQVAEGRQ
jgi:hypothetical protein